MDAAEQRANAVAKLKRAASLPRMRDGRRPPMHVEGVSEGERSQEEERVDSEAKTGLGFDESGERTQANGDQSEQRAEPVAGSEVGPQMDRGDAREPEPQNTDVDGEEGEGEEAPSGHANGNATVEDAVKTTKKRRSRSRTRSRGSKDLKRTPTKQSPQFSSASQTNESSADEYYPSGPGEDAPPSPPLVSPIPSHLANFQASHFLRSPLTPIAPPLLSRHLTIYTLTLPG